MKLILIYSLLLISSITSGQTQLLKDHNFNDGGYTLLGVRLRIPHPPGLYDTLGDFYTDDISVLNQFKKEWVFKKQFPGYKCGYDYQIHICKGGKSIETFYINLSCNELVSNTAKFNFETDKLRMFNDQVKRVTEENRQFGSLSEGRNYETQILNNKELIWAENPYWLKYEGEFSFTYIPKKNKGHLVNETEQILKHLKEQIQNTYPGELFELECKEWSTIPKSSSKKEETRFIIDVRCNMSLANKFNLHPYGWRQWRAYIVELKSYWRPANVQN